MNMVKELNKAMGERIKRVRQEHKLTQKEFADRLGMTAVWQSSVEVGRHQLSADTMKLIHEKFGVSYEYLIEGSGQPLQKSMLDQIDSLQKEKNLLLSIIQQLTRPPG